MRKKYEKALKDDKEGHSNVWIFEDKTERFRDLFPDKTDEIEAFVDDCLYEINDILADFWKLEFDFCILSKDDKNALLINHTISKMEIALESCHHLLDIGYYGSANTLYRQVYEYVVWLKMYISELQNPNKNIQEIFFSSDCKQDAVSYLKNNFKISIPNEYMGKITRSQVNQFVCTYYGELCSLTHGSRNSQQTFIQSENDYSELKKSLFRFVTLLCMSTYSSQLAYSAYGIWRMEIGRDNDYAQRARELHKRSEKLLNKIDSKSIEKIPLQIVIIKGKWEEKITV